MTRDQAQARPPEVLLDAPAVRAIDERLARAGLLELVMEEAGRAVAQAALSLTAHGFATHGRVLLLAGGGANGGDALVAARHLHAAGLDVQVLAQPSRHPLTRANRARLRAVGVQPALLTPAALGRALGLTGPVPALVVDGLLGTGFRPPMRQDLAHLVTLLNAARDRHALTVLAIDLPSGLDAASAALPDVTVHADHTVTLGGPKPALVYGPAAHAAGQVRVAGLGVPHAWVDAHAVARRPHDDTVAALLPQRHADAHKGDAGRVWIVGGHAGTVGAPVLAGLGALRAGAGLVTLHSAESGVATLAVTQAPELMARTHHDPGAALAAELRAGRRPDAVALGMGLGPDAAHLARQALTWQLPTVLDADALQPDLAGAGHAQVIWTPHPGEAARLLGVTTPDIVRDPIAAARALQARLGGVIVLKGGPTTIASDDGVNVSRGGHPGMASAGMGDTLGGILAALLAQRLPAPQAALCGVRLHARAGELAGDRHGYGLSASDLSSELGHAWKILTDAHPRNLLR
ncbi:NAD(P)H-hydrate dehydratase [Deinococcus aquiradiocola]|uniref:Bifunctional NAD(P)H-hydrate repair enzyme n=1 Tax=Deinococcus aquiradiocola TaxID=393059 RepID=A0A917PDX0_9DEIO|nr:NAD(P)H-hydrate dehydratase [Deinococcus aquiradiocola]GGJ72429.1 bifunctional NAD(P)H-hydrate repair enzyme [Deinococcus aquiradiocola]